MAMSTDTHYEVWVDYADAAYRGVLAGKPRKMVAETYSLDDARSMAFGGNQAEVFSREMAESMGQPHFDATYTVWEVTTVRTKVQVEP